MNAAKEELKDEVNSNDYYVKYSRGMICLFFIAGIIIFVFGIVKIIADWQENNGWALL